MPGLRCYAGISLAAASRGCSIGSVWASHCGGFSCCRAEALGHVDFSGAGNAVSGPGLQSADSMVVVQGLRCSAARGILPGHVSCIDRQILYHSATRKALPQVLKLGPVSPGYSLIICLTLGETSYLLGNQILL